MRLKLLASLILLLAAATARAGQPPAAPAKASDGLSAVRQWFCDLAHADPAVREEAKVNLMGMPRRQLEAFQKLVGESRPLRPSQKAVLREIVTHVYLAGDRYDANENFGFLGIEMDRFAPCVLVTKRVPGFPGYRMLRNGDVIVGIAERPDVRCRDSQEFGLAVRALGPGRKVHFEVMRGGRVIRVPVVLDPRPLEADAINGLEQMIGNRRRLADDYWLQAFEPLLKEKVG